MSDAPVASPIDESHAARRKAAKGVGSVAAARLGAVIEVIAQPAYTWLFGLPTYGLYMVLWSLVNLAENIFDLGQTSALQRVLPQAETSQQRAAAVRGALLLGVGPNILVAGIVSLAAPLIAPILNVAAADLPRLVTAIRLFAWALPLWATIEVATSALRAAHAFGPEIRLRILWEQVARLIMAGIFAGLGLTTLGLLSAHLCSLAITAALSLRLLNRYVPLAEVLGTRCDKAMMANLFWSGTSVLPANILARMFTDLPTVLANFLAPGAAGAAASGLYAIARKVASIVQIVRQTFNYVLAPVASAAARGERGTIESLYGFAVRVSLAVAAPTAAALIAIGPALLATFAHGSEAAWPILAILTAARAAEAALGPAGAIQQVIAGRFQQVTNTALGVATAALALFIAAPTLGVIGIAVAVAVGQVTVAAFAVAQLVRHEKLHGFQPPFLRTLIVTLAVCAVFPLLWLALRSLPLWLEGLILFAAWPPLLWVAARFGLAPSDKLAFGKAARTLRL
ncbi:oligosaccharide flippase family protein [Sphingomonas naphthae]|uniref:Oligosaccharide flippase family protein n=1 Tax=Sphingomonas naphthae TaxID=1813468 RepID=A0ABY7TKR0_9SPHN|nr:oligosaccharide flippase family protein [Sphingomonas naphthae]WCT72839.1 oligosaccharide flippase family protein [Sphingomonas naphthae]